MDLQSRGVGVGDSIGMRLPGVSPYESIELRCDVPECSANPIYYDTFDEMYPPSCPDHPAQTLRMASR